MKTRKSSTSTVKGDDQVRLMDVQNRQVSSSGQCRARESVHNRSSESTVVQIVSLDVFAFSVMILIIVTIVALHKFDCLPRYLGSTHRTSPSQSESFAALGSLERRGSPTLPVKMFTEVFTGEPERQELFGAPLTRSRRLGQQTCFQVL
jgi:hypothetical protein